MSARHRTAPALLVIAAVALALAGLRPSRSEDQTPPPAAASGANCQPSTFRVAVDVGHTIKVPGAMSARGIPEYAFNLDLGQSISAALVEAGFTTTALLITDRPPPFGLFVRADRANAMRADLFIAIHHDSVPDNLLETWEYDGQRRGYNDHYPGYAIFISDDNADRAASLSFGQFLGTELQARGLGYTPHYTLPIMGHRRRELVDADAGVYRYDALVVLRKTRMPAVLLEAGSIVNRQEELQLASPERRALIGAAVTAAVEDFCAARQHPKIERQVRRRGVAAASAAAR